MKVSKEVWLLLLLFLGLFVGLRFAVGVRQPEENTASSSFNADPKGTKAFYTLLSDRLGFTVGRLTEPFDRLPESAAVLVVVEPDAPQSSFPLMAREAIGQDEAEAIIKWVRKGGTLIVAADDPLTLPEKMTSTRKLGKGHVYAYRGITRLTNKGMRDVGNAVEMAQTVARHASRQDLILFDEYHHGYGRSRPLWAMIGPRVKRSLWFFAAALILAVYSQGRRFGAVRGLPEADLLRPGSEYVEAVGRLYRRAGATDAAAEATLASFAWLLSMKLGVSVDTVSESAVPLVAALGSENTGDRVGRCLALRDRIAAGEKPTERELLLVTQEVQLLEKELGLERFHA